jgi:hypothetical protein
MKKALLSLVTAAAVGAAGLTVAPQPAHAVAWWVIPAIVGAGVVGVTAGATAQQQYDYTYPPPAYGPRGNVYVQPTAGCHIERQNIDGYWQRVRVCG